MTAALHVVLNIGLGVALMSSVVSMLLILSKRVEAWEVVGVRVSGVVILLAVRFIVLGALALACQFGVGGACGPSMPTWP